jgi:hypothetical protein
MATVTDARFPGGQTILQWAQAELAKLGITNPTVVARDVPALETWANHESGGYNPNVLGGRNNPLNTTEGALGFVSQGGSQGDIKDFGTFQQGVDAQAYNLTHTQRAGYGPILDALRAGNVNALFAAVDASSFGTHGLTASSGIGSGPGPGAPGSASNPAQLTKHHSLDLNPLNWWGDITGGVKGDVAKVGVTLAVLGTGLTLIVLGAWKSVNPSTRQSITKATSLAAAA